MAEICNYGCFHPEHKREVSQSEITKLATEGLKDLIGTIKAADKSRIRFLAPLGMTSQRRNWLQSTSKFRERDLS